MKIKLLLFSILLPSLGYAQSIISGKVTDTGTGEGLFGATVLIDGTSQGTTTDVDGTFQFSTNLTGAKSLLISYIGFEDLIMPIMIEGDVDAGDVLLKTGNVVLAEANVIASIAVDRRTPVAATMISGQQIQALVGNQEYPEILRKTPSIYVTKEGGGFGDARINVRGFTQRNTAVMINGIPVNDMENGWVYWSNWAGLSDVTSNIQVQRGLGASKLAVSSIGGSINIVTNAADMQKGGVVSIGVGNDGYQKYGLSYSTGLSKGGWALSGQLTHTRGDGYVDGTMFRAYSFFASGTKKFNNNHTVAVTVLGAPQWHHQRLIASNFDNITLRTFVDPDDPNDENAETGVGIKWNNAWGMLDGEEFSWRKNFYHKPKAFINHYWNISPKTELKTSAYVSLGRGGGTGPRGRIRAPGSIFDTFSGFGTGTHDENGEVRFDDLVAYHQGTAIAGWGQKLAASSGPLAGSFVTSSSGQLPNQMGTEGSGFIRRASMNSHNWYGILSTLTHQLSSNLSLVAGIDGRYYKGIHYRRVENLLGNDAYLAVSDINNRVNYITEEAPADFGNFGDPSYKDGNNVINYYNDGLVNWMGLFAQIEYTVNNLSVFGALSGSNQGFKRIDYFVYEDSDSEQESDWENILGGTVKAGANYNINAKHNVFFNAGYYSQQPLFDNVYINFRNDVNEEIENQTVTAFELGYGFRSKSFRAKLNLYSTVWGNRQFDRTEENDEGEEIVYQFTDVSQDHKGIELELTVVPVRRLEIFGMLSVGDWKYGNNFLARGQNIDTQQPEGELTLYVADLQVGDAAQTTMSVGADYEVTKGVHVYADWYRAANLYAEYNVNDAQFLQPGGEVVELPAYSLVDAGISYDFSFAEGTRTTLRFNMNNVLDEIYVSELDTNIKDDPTTGENEFYNNKGIFGFGRTWNASLRFHF
ncbi:MAG TPA: TonB-dependent receptor [Saprospiraceae bacterium]|nr:TonB-dependent receptor [Saprospiraceae bacterium]